MSDYLLQESGFRIALEDGSGDILLESTTTRSDDDGLFSASVSDTYQYGATVSDAARYGATVEDA